MVLFHMRGHTPTGCWHARAPTAVGWLGHNCGAVSAFLCGMAQALDIWFGVWQKHLSGRLAELEAGCFSLGSASNPSDG